MSQALLIIDIQNDYFEGGTMELVGSATATAQAGHLLRTFRQRGRPIFHVQHLAARPEATFFLPGTPGAQIHHEVAPQGDEPIFQKHYPNSFRDTGLLAALREQRIETLLVAGMMTHMCVDTTVRAAFDLGFSCTLAADACATRALDYGGVTVPAEQVQAAYLAALNAVFAKVLPVAEILP
ncbi:cysteine hydrolase family protein [Desulfuromonas carbonis]|uniref:cysteine hydrolase family protein n=1 Tax=Desulfuromonas sp. DDH964 TaxID=1823759 RepID=UPI00078ECDCF|nr:cysteine hydrolase family protein [Desulfuromonas sp. DDH964]AMV72429.1 nicotinamidase-like cysteine hydrolase [Desulfuromonas sp. DDH964]